MATNHHDTGYKELFGHPEFVQQLIEGFAPSEIEELMDFDTLTNHSGNYITPLFEEKFEDVVWSVDIHWRGLPQQVYLYILLEFQSRVDRVLAIIQSDPNRDRTDRIITRWLKRHLSRLGAEVHLDQLNSLVEDKDMLAENLENLVKKERLEGRQEGEHVKAEQIARNLISRTEMSDQVIAEVAGLAEEEISRLRSEIKH